MSTVIAARPIPAKADTLKMAVNSASYGADPHYTDTDSDTEKLRGIFETLVTVDDKGVAQPLLATSWKQKGLEWTFQLRKDVYFHRAQGEAKRQKLTKEDVMASMERVLDSASFASSSSYAGLLSTVDMAATRAANPPGSNPYTLKIVTLAAAGTPTGATGDRFLADKLSNISVMRSRDVATLQAIAHDATTPQANRPQAVRAAMLGSAIGTGPYQYVSYDPAAPVPTFLVRRNNSYWSTRSAFAGVSIQTEPDPVKRLAMFQAGQVDFINGLSAQGLTTLASDPGVNLVQRPSMRRYLVFMAQVDDGRITKPGSKPMTDGTGKALESPFVDSRGGVDFRQAIALGFKRSDIVTAAENTVTPTNAFLPEANFVETYDIDAARQAFHRAAQANPDLRSAGLTLTIQFPNDRYPYDAAMGQAFCRSLQATFGNFTVAGQQYSLNVVASTESKSTLFPRFPQVVAGGVGLAIDNALPEGVARLGLLPTATFNYGAFNDAQVTSLYNSGVNNADAAKGDVEIDQALVRAHSLNAELELVRFEYTAAMPKGLDIQARRDDMSQYQTIKRKRVDP